MGVVIERVEFDAEGVAIEKLSTVRGVGVVLTMSDLSMREFPWMCQIQMVSRMSGHGRRRVKSCVYQASAPCLPMGGRAIVYRWVIRLMLPNFLALHLPT